MESKIKKNLPRLQKSLLGYWDWKESLHLLWGETKLILWPYMSHNFYSQIEFYLFLMQKHIICELLDSGVQVHNWDNFVLFFP